MPEFAAKSASPRKSGVAEMSDTESEPNESTTPQEPTPAEQPTEQPTEPTDPNEEENTTSETENSNEVDEITKLQSEMEKYQRAYREEMEQAAKLANDKQETFASALEFFQKNVPLAAAQIVHL